MGEEFRLCYVKGSWAWFTTQDLKDQWGDDWNDVPYEHNAGEPYSFREDHEKEGLKPWKIKKIAWDGPLVDPSEGQANSPYSVEMINGGVVAWLRTDQWHKKGVAIPAGATLQQFIELVKADGGNVYLDGEEG